MQEWELDNPEIGRSNLTVEERRSAAAFHEAYRLARAHVPSCSLCTADPDAARNEQAYTERRELWQDGIIVAAILATTAERADCGAEHYAKIYRQDGPVEIRQSVASRHTR